MENGKEWLELLQRQLEGEIRSLLDDMEGNAAQNLVPQLQTVAEHAAHLLTQALAGQDVWQEQKHLQAQLANIATEHSLRLSQLVTGAITRLLVRALAHLA